MHIVLHGCLPCPPVILISGPQSTFWESSSGHLKMVNELMTMAQKSVHTLAERELAQRWGCQQAKQLPGLLLVLNTWWFSLWIVEHVQQLANRFTICYVNVQNFGCMFRILFEELSGCVSIVGSTSMLSMNHIDCQNLGCMLSLILSPSGLHTAGILPCPPSTMERKAA